MSLCYTFERLARCWQLFVALLLGIVLASTFFAGINVGADTAAKQALDQEPSKVLVDVVVSPVLLADEPTSELDSVTAKMVVDYLVKVSRELGKTIVMVTHDSRVARVADRILRIEDGMINAALTPAQILEPAAAVSYIDQLRARVADIEAQLQKPRQTLPSWKDRWRRIHRTEAKA